MTAPLSRRAARSLLLWPLTLAAPAAAAPCGRPDVDSSFPPPGASEVPPNAVFSAHYSAPAEYQAEEVGLTSSDGNAVDAIVDFDGASSLLSARPREPLSRGSYRLIWPGLRGVGGGVGLGRTLEFSVGSVPDGAAPTFAGLTGLDWDLDRERDACTDKLEDRFVFRLKLGVLSDDARAELLRVLVFETRDPAEATASEPKQVALRAFPGEGGTLELRRPAEHAGETCFAAVAQDLIGNLSGGGEREVCVKTKQPPFFDGCGVARRIPVRGAAPWCALALVTLGFLRRGRSGRAQSRSAA